mgnify:CR=1 FL=1
MAMKPAQKKQLTGLFYAVCGGVLFAAGVNLFITPLDLYNGGFMGIAQLIRTLLTSVFHLSFGQTDIAGIVYFLINLPVPCVAENGKGLFRPNCLYCHCPDSGADLDSNSRTLYHRRPSDFLYHRRTYRRIRKRPCTARRKFRWRTGHSGTLLYKEVSKFQRRKNVQYYQYLCIRSLSVNV